MQQTIASPAVHYELVIGDDGEINLPEELCRELDLQPGDRLIVTREASGALRIKTPRPVLDRFTGIFKHLPPNRSPVDELIEERRAEFLREISE